MKFIWSDYNQSEFDKVIASLSNLDKLEPYNPQHDMFALVDASLAGLGFVLFQKDSKGRFSILQAGSTSLKHAQIRWNIPELDLLAVKYILNKFNFYMAYSRRPITIPLTALVLKITNLETFLTLTTKGCFILNQTSCTTIISTNMFLERQTALQNVSQGDHLGF